jgi:cytochrome oxidase Cu insertion factor (SCO1/SenC/PrrC family)
MRTLLTLFATTALVASGFAGEGVQLHAHDAHGKPFTLESQRGKIVALTFGSKSTKDEVKEVNDALAKHSGRDFEVVSVVDFEDIPDIAKGMARDKVAKSDRPGELQHVVDPDGEMARSFHVDAKSHVDILVLDKRGVVRGRYDGKRGLADAEKKIAELRSQH